MQAKPPQTARKPVLHQPPTELAKALEMPAHERCKKRNIVRRDSIAESIRRGWPGH